MQESLENIEPEQTQRFESLFTGLKRAYGYSRASKRRNAEGKVQTFNKTVIGSLTTEKYRAHLTGEEALGVVPIDDGDVCQFGAIDIDQYDELDHAALAAKLKENNLPLVVCQSKSGGAHLYAFFTQPTDAASVRNMLMRISVMMGQPGVEIFPKQTELASEQDVGNWINLPYFGGSRTAIDSAGNTLTLDQFLTSAEQNCIDDLEYLAVTTPEAFSDGPPCLQQLAQIKVPNGARNNALVGFGTYARKKYPDEWEEVLEDYNRRYMDTPLSAEEVLNVIKSLRKKEYGYKCQDTPLCDHCSRELCLSRRYGIQPGSDDNASVQIDGITKIDTTPPLWIVGVEGRRIVLNTDELMDQNKFRKRVVERTNRFMSRMKAQNWDAMLKQKIEEVRVEEAPNDASDSGQLQDYLERWLTDHPLGTQRSQLLLGMPVEDGERVYFRSNDFFEFLQRNRFSQMTKPEIWTALRDNEHISHSQLNVQGRCVQVWIVKMPNHNKELPATSVADSQEY